MTKVAIKYQDLHHFLKYVESEHFMPSIIVHNDLVYLKFSDDQAEYISEKIKYALIEEGFDMNYNLNSKGVILQRLVDSFVKSGW